MLDDALSILAKPGFDLHKPHTSDLIEHDIFHRSHVSWRQSSFFIKFPIKSYNRVGE